MKQNIQSISELGKFFFFMDFYYILGLVSGFFLAISCEARVWTVIDPENVSAR